MDFNKTHYSVRQNGGSTGSSSIRNMFPLHSVTSKQPESPYGAKEPSFSVFRPTGVGKWPTGVGKWPTEVDNHHLLLTFFVGLRPSWKIHGKSMGPMGSHGSLWDPMGPHGSHGTPWGPHGSPWGSHGVPWVKKQVFVPRGLVNGPSQLI